MENVDMKLYLFNTIALRYINDRDRIIIKNNFINLHNYLYN